MLRLFCDTLFGRRMMILEEADFKNAMVLISFLRRTEKRQVIEREESRTESNVFYVEAQSEYVREQEQVLKLVEEACYWQKSRLSFLSKIPVADTPIQRRTPSSDRDIRISLGSVRVTVWMRMALGQDVMIIPSILEEKTRINRL